jgi:hypothetical protein
MTKEELKRQIVEARAQRAGLALKVAELTQERAQQITDLAMTDLKIGQLAMVGADMDVNIAKLIRSYHEADL